MKHKPEIKRWSRRIIPQGHSLCVGIPSDLVKAWDLTLGQEMVVYQLHEALVVVPLQTLLKKGELKIIKPLQEALT